MNSAGADATAMVSPRAVSGRSRYPLLRCAGLWVAHDSVRRISCSPPPSREPATEWGVHDPGHGAEARSAELLRSFLRCDRRPTQAVRRSSRENAGVPR
jgi:hypothetical protein